jgi:hypothetical protein
MVFLRGIFVLILKPAISGQQSAISKNEDLSNLADNG